MDAKVPGLLSAEHQPGRARSAGVPSAAEGPNTTARLLLIHVFLMHLTPPLLGLLRLVPGFVEVDQIVKRLQRVRVLVAEFLLWDSFGFRRLFLRPRPCHGDCPCSRLFSAASISSHDGARQRWSWPCAFLDPTTLPSGENAEDPKSDPWPSNVSNSW